MTGQSIRPWRAFVVLAVAALLASALLSRRTPTETAATVSQLETTPDAEVIEVDLPFPESSDAREPSGESTAFADIRRERSADKNVRLDGEALLHVRVFEGVYRARWRLVRAVLRDDVGPTDVLYEGRTDGDAEVSFVVPPERSFDVFAAVEEGGWSKAERFVSPKAGKQRYVRLRLPHVTPSRTMIVRVHSMPGDRPLAGAKVRGTWSDGVRLRLSPERTDARGELVVPWDRKLDLQVAADGHGPATLDAPREQPEEPVRVDLCQYARLHGVAASDGIVGVRFARGGNDRGDRGRTIRTSADGSWSIDDVTVQPGSGEVVVLGVVLRRGRAERELSGRFEISAGETREVADPWAGAPPLTVAVSAEGGGVVPTGLTAELLPGTSSDDASTRDYRTVAVGTSNEAGRIEFGPVPRGSYVVLVLPRQLILLTSEDGSSVGEAMLGGTSKPGDTLQGTAQIEHDGRSAPIVIVREPDR
ncbi:MAG: hypothetical protein AAF726_07645 [Planctomycetota bacterium]